MSIILDALRKSEAARRRHQAPELFAEMHERAPAPRAPVGWPRWAMVGGVALGVGALAFAVWFASRTTTPDIDPREAADVDATPSVDSAANVDPTGDDSASAPPVEAHAPPFEAPNGSSAPQMPMPATQAGHAPPVVPPSAVADAPAITTTTPASAAPSVAPSVAAPLPAPPRAAPPASTPTTTGSRDAAAAAPVVETPPPAFRSPGNETPMALSDLDAETRKQLPPLKLSMHMWHDVPMQRFVILDGRRLREGDVIGDVVVQRITRDGATLSWRGTALKIEWR
jgi:general secretion pathway protein B